MDTDELERELVEKGVREQGRGWHRRRSGS